MSIVEEELELAAPAVEGEGLALTPELAGTLMTPEEFDSAIDWEEGFVFELIHGVLVVSPPPGIGERAPTDLLAQLLRNYADQHPQGDSFLYTVSEHTIRSAMSRRRADRVIWIGLGRLPSERDDFPMIIAEFVSKSRRDRKQDYEEKRDEYLETGVKEYLVIDRFLKRMSVFRLESGRIIEQVVPPDQSYSTPLLPGFELPLARILTHAEMIERAQK